MTKNNYWLSEREMKSHTAHLRFHQRGGEELSLQAGLSWQEGGKKMKVAFCLSLWSAFQPPI